MYFQSACRLFYVHLEIKSYCNIFAQTMEDEIELDTLFLTRDCTYGDRGRTHNISCGKSPYQDSRTLSYIAEGRNYHRWLDV